MGSRRIVILYTGWSQCDKDLVSELERKVSETGTADNFHFIDVSVIKAMPDFEKYIPGIGNVYQTPAVGVWDGEPLLYKGTGFEARQYLRQQYGLAVFSSLARG